ncbi:MAG: EAL domain-containing protein, partial [Actinomycetota bacterium]|nr:EAL domain-containing protein [Actinomycetota bacterium]
IFASARMALNNRNEAHRDQLTSLPNRRMFEEHGALMLEGATAAKDLAAVIQLDLNGFKRVNDQHGHRYGDIVLRTTADRLTAAKRADELVARFGGDEFAIIVRSINSAEDAKRIADRLLRAISHPIEHEGLTLQVGGSFGVAIYPEHADDLASLLHHADQAMYRAKSMGGGVAMYQPFDYDDPEAPQAAAADILGGIERREFFLAYQPIVQLSTGTIISLEALLRWQHADRGLLLPGVFIGDAERSGIMSTLTNEVVRLATDQLADWRDRGIDTRVVINVTNGDFHDLDFPARVAGALGRRGLDPRCLQLELTEQTIMRDPAYSREIVKDLRDLGVGVGIDEFGTGYSSLPLLWELAPDRIKIDRSIIGGLRELSNRSIALAAVELCRSLGISTVAVGAESDDDLQIVKELGFDGAQGHLLGHALSADELALGWRNGRVELGSQP